MWKNISSGCGKNSSDACTGRSRFGSSFSHLRPFPFSIRAGVQDAPYAHQFMLRFGRVLVLFPLLTTLDLPAQDLAPRAYVITPIHTNAVTLTWGYYNGGLNFGGTIPITGATGSYSVPVISLYHTMSFFGRSANLTASLPYAVGTFEGAVLGTQTSAYRSGLVDSSFRFSVNLLGGPAMPVQEFARWKQKTLLGGSLRVIAPTGQYNGTKLINWGINRWAFKLR